MGDADALETQSWSSLWQSWNMLEEAEGQSQLRWRKKFSPSISASKRCKFQRKWRL